MEMSHRSAAFEGIIQKAEADLRSLLGLGPDHAVLFLQGGASLQFAMVPANLRAAGASADYVLSGHWSKAALKEAQKSGRARVAGSTESSGFDRVPAQGELDLDPGAAYLHFTSNNTIYGTQWSIDPEPPARRAARLRRLLRRPQPARGRRAPGPLLRGRAEEPRPGGGHAGDRPEGPPRADPGRSAGGARLPPDGGEPLALQHAADLRDLRRGPRPGVAEEPRRARRGRRSGTRRRRRSSTKRSTAAAGSTAGTPTRPAARA